MEQADCKKNIRTFIAIPFPEKIILFLMKIQEKIKTKKFRASWSKVNAMHLTLKFIGDTRQNDIDKIIQAMEQTAEFNSPFSLSAGGVGLFPIHFS
ncbi:MAG: 2'-5' RNA ligase family protein [Thermodesulfobacteriota bacterium]|nr:2'-5' RNA ligase family protein [Thermodesulfobacteriota bacterium]